MNLKGNRNLNINQDSLKTKPKELSVEVSVPTSNLKVERKKEVITAIPETPKRFQQPKRKTEPLKKVFIPSSQDSVDFNLKIREESEDILENTVVRDFLQPLKQSDKQWLGISEKGEVASIKIQYKRKEEVETKKDSIPIVAESEEKDTIYEVKSVDTTKVKDAVFSEDISKTEAIKETIIKEPDLASESKKEYSKDILTGLLILSVAITGIIRITYFKYLRELFSSVVFGQYARKIQKTENMRNQKAALILKLLFLFNAAIFCYEYIHYNHIETFAGQSMLLIPLIMFLFLVFGLVKRMLYWFVAFVFECEQETKDYIFYSSLHSKVFGLLILPVILVIPYIEVESLNLLFNIGIGLFILLYLVQLFRGLTIILRNLASLFYMFLYLCALEILPLIIMYNILIN